MDGKPSADSVPQAHVNKFHRGLLGPILGRSLDHGGRILQREEKKKRKKKKKDMKNESIKTSKTRNIKNLK
jgi:hypothetical protein